MQPISEVVDQIRERLYQIQSLKHRILYPEIFIFKGRHILIQYINYHAQDQLSFRQARKYLAWLLAANVGRHYLMEKEGHDNKLNLQSGGELMIK